MGNIMKKPHLEPCPICGGSTAWCGTHDENDIHDCHFIVCTGECKTQFDTVSDDNAGTIEELMVIAAQKFNNRKTQEKTMEPQDFGWAIKQLKAGNKVCRSGWNGKNMFVFLVPGSTFKVNRPPLMGIYPEGTEINYHAHIDMRTVDGTIVPWLASQSDMLADDWELVE